MSVDCKGILPERAAFSVLKMLTSCHLVPHIVPSGKVASGSDQRENEPSELCWIMLLHNKSDCKYCTNPSQDSTKQTRACFFT